MSLTTECMSPADIAAITGDNNGFGGNGAWWIIVLFLFGWNRGGFGGLGGGTQEGYTLASDFATLQRQISDSTNATERKLDSISNGLCDGFYTQAQLVNGVNQNISAAQYGITNALTTSGYETRNAINAVSSQLAQCCCDNKSAIADLKYTMAQDSCAIGQAINNSARDIIDNQNATYRALHDEIVANRIEDKNAQIAAQNQQIFQLQLAASQSAQNAYLTNALRPCPVPAYTVPNPFCGCNYGYNGTTLA